MKNRAKWADVAKFLAIIAVMIDHTNGFLYTDQRIAYSSYFSVSMFILVMGITTMWSYQKDSSGLIRKIGRKCLGILRPYIVATVIYGVCIDKVFNFESLLDHLIHFNMSGPFYYVFLYCQLVLISPLLFCFFRKTDDRKLGFVIEFIGLIAVMAFSSWTVNYTNILGIFAAGRLFGGTYLILFYLGMWFGKYYNKIKLSVTVSVVLTVVSLGCTVAVWRFITFDKFNLDSRLPFGGGINPPGVSLGVYACFIALTLYFAEMALRNVKSGILEKVACGLVFIGRHTLYIFLYHLLFRDVILPKLIIKTGISMESIPVRWIVYLPVMVFAPLLVELILEKFHKVVLEAYGLKTK